MAAPRRASPRVDATGADVGSLAAMGRVPAPGVPSPDPPARPDRGGPQPDPGRVQRAGALADALADAGLTQDADDIAAVEALAGLDEATVVTVAGWIRRGGREPGGGRRV